MPNILLTICARGGSKGIPGKNIKPINGLPLIAYTIRTAQAFAAKHQADLALSTDSEEIKKVAAEYGLTTTYVRPEEMATDAAGKLQVIRSLVEYEEQQRKRQYELVIDFDVTSPLRTVADVEEGLSILLSNKEAANLFSVNKAHRNPYFNMVEEQPDGFYTQVKQGKFLTRQSAPKVYDLNASFYIFKRDFFDKYEGAITPKSLIYEMPHICFDLDEPLDYEFLSYLLTQEKLGFAL